MDRSNKLQHGTLEGYKRFRCRCKKCTSVWELYLQEYRDEIFDETKAKVEPVRFYYSYEDYSEKRKRW